MSSLPLPSSHVQSLVNIENGYWWYLGRVFWASELIAKVATAEEKKNFLYADLGCGSGGFANCIRNKFSPKKTLLVDGDASILKQTERFADVERLNSDLSSVLTLPFAPNLVTCMDVIEHLEQEEGFLRNLSKQMAPKGLAIISAPALPLLFSSWDSALGHKRRYNKRSFLTLLDNAGFTVEFCSYMWSALTPLAFSRKLRNLDSESVTFDNVPSRVNRMLLSYAQNEFKFAQEHSLPFGTSLIAVARSL